MVVRSVACTSWKTTTAAGEGAYSQAGVVNVTNSFAVPFEEDEKDPKIWFVDHNYLENMFGMFKKVNAREKIVGWYSTGPKIRSSDLEINEVGGDEHTGFDGGARGDNRNGEVRCPYLLEGAHVARVKDGGVSNAIGPLLHQGRVFIDGQHIATKFVELASGGRAKAP